MGELEVGERLSLTTGPATVTAVRVELLAEPVKVYNFQVADWHTYYAAPEADKPFVWVHNADYGNPKVRALYEQGNEVFEDVNPTARPAKQRTGESIPAPAGGNGAGLTNVNNTTTKMHAEIGAMYQAFRAGKRGGRGTLLVEGQQICPYCGTSGDIFKMARLLELDELEVHDLAAGRSWRFLRKDFLGSGSVFK